MSHLNLYSLSKNYAQLFEVVCSSNSVICFVDYHGTRRLCLLEESPLEKIIYFWVHGMGYRWVDKDEGLETFIDICEEINLEWVTPTKSDK